MATRKLVFIDCDSTLSAIEGIDELARLRGAEVFEACANMTNCAMDGEIELEAVYGERLKLINPSLEECLKVGQQYIDTVESTAPAFIAWLKENDWYPVIVSGGITQAIQPFAQWLGIERVEAVPLLYGDDGAFLGYDEAAPTSRMGGKNDIIRRYKVGHRDVITVMIGDGSSDLETQEDVDLFIGYGGFTARENVRKEPRHFISELSAATEILGELS